MGTRGDPRQLKSMTFSKRGGKGRGGPPERRRQFTPRKRTSESECDGVCDLCVQKIKIYAIGHCNHPICFRCSAKMRVLCEQLDCPVCRTEMKKVIYTPNNQLFADANKQTLIYHRKNDVWFIDEEIEKQYKELFKHPCSVCPNGHSEPSFESLETHMWKTHKLFYCNLCVKFNTNFTDECKTYTRETLARHRRVGDDDDFSHKGHPLCEFCDERYLDKDALLHHLRKDHYFCHFCDQDGKNQYYDGYNDLRQHYREDHFLCEEGDCINEQFTSVFATELDLKAHRTAAHKDSLTRQQQKVERNIDLGFQYPKPSRGGRGRDRDGGRMGSRNERPTRDEDQDLARAIELSKHDHSSKLSVIENSNGKRERPRVQREQPKQQPEREPTPPPNLVTDFPTLGTSENDKQDDDPYAYTSVHKPQQNQNDSQGSNGVKHTAGPTAAYRVAAAAGRSVGRMTDADFPTLGVTEPSRAQSAGMWATVSSGKSKNQKSAQMKASKVNQPTPGPTIHHSVVEDFPILGGRPPPVKPVAKPTPPAPKKPVSVNVKQFSKSNVDFKNKDEFPTLGGGTSNSSQTAIWGPGAVPAVTAKKSKKQKTPLTQQQTAPKKKPPPPAVKQVPAVKTAPPVIHPQPARDYDPMMHNDTVSVRIGSHKHTMRLTSTDYSAALEGVEKPIEVPGVGTNSVRTVTADAFSLLSHKKQSSGKWSQQDTDVSKFNATSSDFPELGGGKGGRIQGIGSANSSWSNETNHSKISLASMSKEVISPSMNENTNSYFDQDCQTDVKPPPLSSYSANWSDSVLSTPSTSVVDDNESKNESFQHQEEDFPTLGGISTNNDRVQNKKKKKKKKGQTSINDLSKHFGNAHVDESANHLGNLLSQKGDQKHTLSDVVSRKERYAPKVNSKSTSKTDNLLPKDQSNGDARDADEADYELDPRPDADDIQGRNMWLITTVQHLCGTEENFNEFKISSGQFRQGILPPDRYYEKCRILLGKQHFDTVFRELVDLLPDAEKREDLMRIHLN